MDDLIALAVKSSLDGNWEQALKLNMQIIKGDSKNIQALSRLGKAQAELGLVKEAQSTYQKVLKMDPINTIAKRNLERLKSYSPSKTPSSNQLRQVSNFIEEPGKTKTITLIKLASQDVLTRLSPGETVTMAPRQHSISVTRSDGTNIGRLPDDLSARLLPMIKGGNSYSALIRSVYPNSVKVMIREEKRGKRFLNTPSFPSTDNGSYIAYLPVELIDENEASAEGSDEEETDKSD